MKTDSTPYSRILVPTDGSRLADRALAAALALARPTGARIVALHVIPEYPPPKGIVPEPAFYTSADYRKASEARAKRLLAKVATRARMARVPCDVVFARDSAPWKAILRIARARRCGLFAMASHGRSGLEAVILGSET